jgi:phospholipid transport system substrate-binding protein
MVRNVWKRWSLVLVSGQLLAVAASPAVAQADEVPPAAALSDSGQVAIDFVRQKHDELQAAVKASKDPKTDAKVLAIFDAMFDYDALAQDSLGTEWDGLTDAQRAEFSGVLKQLVEKSYRKNLRDPSNYAVQYLGTEPAPNGTLVKTTAQSKVNKREKPLPINYVVGTTSQGHKVRDVITDEISLVGNYRSQFKKSLKKKGFDGLLEQLRKQLDK